MARRVLFKHRHHRIFSIFPFSKMRIWWTVSTHLGPNILTKKTPHYILWYRCLLLGFYFMSFIHVIYPKSFIPCQRF